MSRTVATLVYSRRIGSTVRKAVLAYCADRASDDGRGIWASKQRIADEIECDRRTVIRTMNALIAEGLLIETGTRACRGGSTIEYRIDIDAVAALPLTQSSDRVSPVTESHQGQGVTLGSDTVSPEPSLNRPVVKEASASSTKRARKLTGFPAPDGVPEGTWLDFLNSPNRRKAGMSATAYAGIANNLNSLAEHGFPPGEMIALAVERGWKTVKLEWVQNDGQQRNGTGQRLSGPRPDPTLDIVRRAREAQRRNLGNHGQPRIALPSR